MANVSRKGLHLDFDRMSQLGYLDPITTLSRPSGGAQQGFDWAWTQAAANAPRFINLDDWKRGLIVEGQSTNLCPSNSSDANETGTTTGGYSDPSGGASAQRHVQTGGGRVLKGFSAQPSASYVFSIYLKGSAGGETVGLRIYVNNDTEVAFKNVVLTTNWTRYTVSVSNAAANVNRVAVSAAAGGVTFYSWGWQCEGPYVLFASTYIPTSGAAATRAADELSSVNNLQIDCGFYSYARGTIIVDFNIPRGSPRSAMTDHWNRYVLRLTNDDPMTDANNIHLYAPFWQNNQFLFSMASASNNDMGCEFTFGDAHNEGRKRLVVSWEGRNVNWAANGVVGGGLTATKDMPIVTKLHIGKDGRYGNFGGYALRNLQLLPVSFPKSVVQQLSRTDLTLG